MFSAALVFDGGLVARAQVSAAEEGFMALMSQERQSRGLQGYVRAADLVEVARAHAQRMAASGQPYHNPNLGSDVQNWMTVGENVGMGYDVQALHDLFMASPTHRANILAADYTEVGVGVLTTPHDVIWVVVVFRLPYDSPAAPPPVTPTPTSPPEPAPAVADPATTSTVPPETVAAAPDTTPVPAVTPEVLAAQAAVEPQVTVLVEGTPIALQLPKPVRDVPPQAWLAALLINLVVGLQALAVRRLRTAPAAG